MQNLEDVIERCGQAHGRSPLQSGDHDEVGRFRESTVEATIGVNGWDIDSCSRFGAWPIAGRYMPVGPDIQGCGSTADKCGVEEIQNLGHARGLGSRASKMDATLSEDLQVRFRAPNVSPTQSRPAATVASRNIQRSASLKSNYVFAFGIEKAKECNINAQECGTFSSPLYKPIVLRVYIWDCLSPLRAQVVSRRRLVLLKVYCKLANRSKEAYSTAWDATNV
ncbi:hypothetical protein R3P38DRAFT_2785680 [Favolaschia claudopus]|uniref:Uncharacterized protein n=1 Tax=Favolaschia claudopus TaxID=2862362 RepID=A0AAW0AVD2_9AGAR